MPEFCPTSILSIGNLLMLHFVLYPVKGTHNSDVMSVIPQN